MAEGVDTYSKAWRHECEVRYVVNLPTIERRRDYLDAITKRRGEAAGRRLRDDVRAAWLARQRGPISPKGVAGARDESLTTRPAGVPPAAEAPGMGPSAALPGTGHSNLAEAHVHGARRCSTPASEGVLA